MPCETRVVRVTDPLGLKEGLRGSDLEACQLSESCSASELARFATPELCVDMVHFSPALIFEGETPRNCYTLIFVVACPTLGRSFNFGIDHTDGYMGFFAPGAALESFTPPGYRNASLIIPENRLAEALARRGYTVPDAVLRAGVPLRIGAAAQIPLRACVRDLWDGLWEGVSFAKGAPQVARDIEEAFVEAFVEGLESKLPPRPPRMNRRYARLRKARNFLRENAARPLYLDDLCTELGLGSRTLETLFREHFQIGPMAYLKSMRLQGAHADLRKSAAATPPLHTVKEIAMRWGFWHLGRFSHDYVQRFGVLPSDTRKGTGLAGKD